MSESATLACPRCQTPLVSLSPGATVGRVSIQCARCGEWLLLGQGPQAGWLPLPAGLAGPGRTAAGGLGPIDWFLAAAGVGGGLALAVLGVAMRRFLPVFASTGGELPALTRLVLGSGVPFLLAALSAALAVAGAALRHRGSATGRPLLVLAVVVTLVGAPLCLLSMYLPIFSMADAIR